MSHTPGPWEVSKHGTPDYAPQYGVHGGRNDHAIVMGDNAEADASLIAAAPELLEALERCLEWMHFTIDHGRGMNYGGPIHRANNALAKAKGAN